MPGLLSAYRVREVMTRGVVTVHFTSGVGEVLREMVENDVTAVVVVNSDGETMGVISSVDIMRKLAGRSREEASALSAEDIMTPHTIAISPESSVEEAAQVMLERGIHRLVITQEKPFGSLPVPVGILSATDLVKLYHTELAGE
ncbi:MAG: CBS domain-containing protein [Euryarchaeota archaeon]|nr:CBS domain-containing protein [Euryarchaeota archaeon]